MPLAGFSEAVWIACGSNFRFGFVWQEWDGQLSPSFKFKILQRFWSVKIRPRVTQHELAGF